MDNKLEEIITEAIQEEAPPSPPPPPPPPEPEAPKKKRVATEKQLAALAKGRETRARNKAEKDRMKGVKLKMLERIHDRVESFDLSGLMSKLENIAPQSIAPQRYSTGEYEAPKPKPKKKIETPEIEEEPEEEEEDCPCFFTTKMKPTIHDTGENDFFCK